MGLRLPLTCCLLVLAALVHPAMSASCASMGITSSSSCTNAGGQTYSSSSGCGISVGGVTYCGTSCQSFSTGIICGTPAGTPSESSPTPSPPPPARTLENEFRYQYCIAGPSLSGDTPDIWYPDTCLYLGPGGSYYLHGTMPTEIGLLTTTLQLTIQGCPVTECLFIGGTLTGTIPTEVGLMTSLTKLDLRYNELTGTIPTEVGLMTSLTQLSLWNNTLTGTMPTELGLLTAVAALSVENNAGMYGCIVSVGGNGRTYTNGTEVGITGCSSPPSPPPAPVVEVQAQTLTPPTSLASRPTTAVWTLLLATVATLAALLMA